MYRRITRPLPEPEHWASVQPRREFQGRLAWYRHQPGPQKWPSRLVRLFVGIQVETGQDYLEYVRRFEVLQRRAAQSMGKSHDPG